MTAIEFYEKGVEYELGPTSSISFPTRGKFYNWTVAVCKLDLNSALVEFSTIRQVDESDFACNFAVRSLSLDGTKAILQTVHPIPAQTTQKIQNKFRLSKVFGRRQKPSLCYGIEIWDIEGSQPFLERTIPYHNFQDNGLMHPTTFKMQKREKAEFKKAINLLILGLCAVLSGRKKEWENSVEKIREDDFYLPGETGQEKPSYQHPYWRVFDPMLFGGVMRQILSVHPEFPQNLPWSCLTNRQKYFVEHIMYGWGFHAKTPIMSLAWIDNMDHFLILGRNGILREISCTYGPGRAYEIVDRPKTFGSLNWRIEDAELIHLGNRNFAIIYYGTQFEFMLPESTGFGSEYIDTLTPIPIQIIKDREQHQKETKAVNRLVSAIRPGYIKIESLQSKHVISGLNKLADELHNNYHEMVIDSRWMPSLWLKRKAVGEQEFCTILHDTGSEEAIAVLEKLLGTYIACSAGKIQDAWHLDDVTPTMGSVAITLIKMCDTIPDSVVAFIDQIDIDHDSWTDKAFSNLELTAERLSAPDLLLIRIRLALQGIARGYLSKFFERFGLDNELKALNETPSLVDAYAKLILTQSQKQWPTSDSDNYSTAQNVIKIIIASLDINNTGEAALKKVLTASV